MIDRDCLKAGGEAVGVPVDADLAERLDTYARLLAEWNEKMNLTAITEPGAMVVKHFVDSLAAAPLLPAGSLRLIDVGTGAGFPGVPLALYRRDIQLTLLDSLNKQGRGGRPPAGVAGAVRCSFRPCGGGFAYPVRILPALCAAWRNFSRDEGAGRGNRTDGGGQRRAHAGRQGAPGEGADPARFA